MPREDLQYYQEQQGEVMNAIIWLAEFHKRQTKILQRQSEWVIGEAQRLSKQTQQQLRLASLPTERQIRNQWITHSLKNDFNMFCHT